jgi:hypothetical protein
MTLGFAGAWLAAIEVECTKSRHPDLVGLASFSHEAFEHIAKLPLFRPESEAANHSTAISGRKSTTLARVAKRSAMPPHGKGTVRPLDPDDPRNPRHPSRREVWLELADAIGEEMAQRDFERLHKKGNDSDGDLEATKDSSDLRPILKR